MSLTFNTSTSTTTAAGVGGGRPPKSPFHRNLHFSRTSHIVGASNKSTPRTGKFDSKNRRNSSSVTTIKDLRTTIQKDEEDGGGVGESNVVYADDGFVVEDLDGMKPNFWEGEKWDGLGFFVQYMWAFGIVFAVAACGVAVATYNEGATDFKATPVYKDAIESQELLEGPEASNSDVFEANPTEEAPSLE